LGGRGKGEGKKIVKFMVKTCEGKQSPFPQAKNRYKGAITARGKMGGKINFWPSLLYK